jgi:toxin YoeB
LLKILAKDPLQNPPTFEKLVGDLAGAYSRRINILNRLVYEIFPEEKLVRVSGCRRAQFEADERTMRRGAK